MRVSKLISLVGISMAMTLNAANPIVGGQFKDRILPMQGSTQKNPGEEIWGASGVQNRFLDNGTENPDLSFWGGDIHMDSKGKYYMYIAGWDSKSRAHSYWSNSDIYYVTADNVWGPYTKVSNIGKGHNPSLFIAKDGTFVVYALIGNSSAWRYTSDSVEGPWKFESMPLDLRGRALSTGSVTTYSNWTFAQRPDGSIYCLDRGGAVWISEDGLSPFENTLGSSCYPNGGGGSFEDPVVWKDEFQYHMIVNDWKAKIAYYSRSKDGFTWVHEAGTAYDTSVAVHPDGTSEEWFKFERPRIFQDQYGRATQLNMAVIDVEKGEDLAGDNHSSKNIVLPLNPGLRMAVLNEEAISTSTPKIMVVVYKEPGFDPTTDLDLTSLRFGKYSVVNEGKGASVVSSEADSDGNLILTFSGSDTGIQSDEFAPKLIGKYNNAYINPATPTAKPGGMCFGYARLPYIDYTPEYLSPSIPSIGEGSKLISVNVKNFGLKASSDNSIKILSSSNKLLATGSVPSLNPYQSTDVELESSLAMPASAESLKVEIYKNDKLVSTHVIKIEDVMKARKKLLTLIAEVDEYLESASYKYGKDELRSALEASDKVASSSCISEIDIAFDTLLKALNNFKFANASSKRPVAITISNPQFDSTDGWDILHEGSAGGFQINNRNNKDYNKIGQSEFLEAYNGTGIISPNYARQCVDELPSGRYAFEADVIVQKGTAGGDGVFLFLGDNSVKCSSVTANHSEHYSVECTLDSESPLLFGINIENSCNATWVAIDNATLLYYGDGSHDNDEILPDVNVKHYTIKAANSTLNNIHVYADSKSGTMKRSASHTGDTGIFSIITDNENKRVYMYNHATKSFVVPAVGNSAVWNISSEDAVCIGGLSKASTNINGYVIKGDPESGNSYNFMNALRGFNAADRDGIGSYTQGDTGSEWLLTEVSGLSEYDTTAIINGRDQFIETLKLIPNITIDGETSYIVSNFIDNSSIFEDTRFYNLQGVEVSPDSKGIRIIVNSNGGVTKSFLK
ncbi:MAG: glycoside hydrolase family protein [Muribaculaceae bacterium]|nr:glycoside hydrolase family protein [Muribaculaceae bacterium]